MVTPMVVHHPTESGAKTATTSPEYKSIVTVKLRPHFVKQSLIDSFV